MRTLNFIVDGQIVKRDPACDFSGLIPGTKNYLHARFSFSKEWDRCTKVVGFYSMMGKEYGGEKLDDLNSCMIPAEACAKQNFQVKVFGIGANGLNLTTNKVTVSQNGGSE